MFGSGARAALAAVGVALLLTACSEPQPPEPRETESPEAPWPTPSPTADVPDVDPLEALGALGDELSPAPIGAAAINPWGVSVTHLSGQTWNVVTQFNDPAIEQELREQELVLGQATLEDLALPDLESELAELGCSHHAMGTSSAMPGGAVIHEMMCTDEFGVALEHRQLVDGQELVPYTGGLNQETIQRALDDAQRIHGETFESILFERSEQGQDIRAFSVTEHENPLHDPSEAIGETCQFVADFGGEHRHPLDVQLHCNNWYMHYTGDDLYVGDSTAADIMEAITLGAEEIGVEVAEIRSVEVQPFGDTAYVNLRLTPLFGNDDIATTQAFDNEDDQS